MSGCHEELGWRVKPKAIACMSGDGDMKGQLGGTHEAGHYSDDVGVSGMKAEALGRINRDPKLTIHSERLLHASIRTDPLPICPRPTNTHEHGCVFTCHWRQKLHFMIVTRKSLSMLKAADVSSKDPVDEPTAVSTECPGPNLTAEILLTSRWESESYYAS